MQLERQFPSGGRLDGYLLLHVFLSAASMMFFSVIFFVSCALMIFYIFHVHPFVDSHLNAHYMKIGFLAALCAKLPSLVRMINNSHTKHYE